MITTRPTDPGLRALRDGIDGRVIAAGEEGYDEARLAWNLVADQRPALVAVPRSARDVQKIVRYAVITGLRVTMQGTGHNATPHGDLGDTILVKTHEMRGVTIDAEKRIARAEAGAQWLDVTGPASELGLAALSGSAPDVGVVGYTLGGGLSIGLGRRYGLAAERVTAIELVTADGELVRADRRNHSDLFWALRGGGGSFGAVTAIEFELIPLAQVYAGMMLWPVERAAEVLQAWREWTSTAPDAVTTSARIMRFPPLPELPPFLSGRSLVLIDGGYVGDEASARELFAPLRALEPEMDTFAMVPPVELSHIHMDPPDPMPGLSDTAMLDELPAEAVDRILALAGEGAETPLLMIELRHVGGALGRRGEGALGAFDGNYLFFAAGLPLDAGVAAAIEAHLAIVTAALRDYGHGRHYLNFAERATDPAAFYGEESYARLRRIKGQVDPQDVFRANHPITAG